MTHQPARLTFRRFLPMAFVCLGILLSGNLAAQEGGSLSNAAIARTHIMGLREGALLVRLQTRSQSIETLKERGMEDRADQLEQRQRRENAEYVEAFVSEFDFAPVYFFRSEDSGLIKAGRLDEVVFLNSDLIPDSTIKVAQQMVYTAEFGNIEADNEKIRQDYRLEKDSTGVKQKATYYGSANMGFEALVIMDDQFVQLRRPFPYYVRTFGKKGIITRSPAKAVRKMNTKLHQFY
ncbi:MAG: hypothetical protein WBG42_06260 [Cryomorphaceae bacterium]